MEYRIVVHNVTSNFIDFVLEINTRMKEGWKPQGGLAILKDREDIYFYQAMIKE